MPANWNRLSPLISAGIFLIFLLWRCMSRNIQKRQMEDMAAAYLWNTIKGKFTSLIQRFKRGRSSGRPNANWADANYKTFTCPKCKQKLRVPRGKGKIIITCSKCGEKFKKKT